MMKLGIDGLRLTTVTRLGLLVLMLGAAPGSAQLAAAPSTMVTGPQGRIEVFANGQGPVVLMIASLGRPASDFDDLAARLATAGYRAVRYNASGIGRSAGPMQGVSLQDLAADAAAVIEANGGGPAVVLGHAFGQRVARMLAAQHPNLVKSVIALAAGGREPVPFAGRLALTAVFVSWLPDYLHLKAVRYAFFADGNDATVWRDGWYPATATMQVAATRASNIDDWWGARTAPLLVIQGLQDTIALPANGRALKQAFGARVELVEADGAGHALLPEQPRKVAESVIDFLKRP